MPTASVLKNRPICIVEIEGRGEAVVSVYVDDTLQYSNTVVVPLSVNVSGLNHNSVVKVTVSDGQNTSYVNSTTVDIFTLECPLADVALRKKLDSQQLDAVKRGSAVTFVIEVINQGNVVLTGVSVVDYIPANLQLIEDGMWTQEGANAVAKIGSLPVGESVEVPITFVVLESALTNEIILNYAEVSVEQIDIDSEGDLTNGNGDGETTNLIDNEVNNKNGDEDDHDVAEIVILAPNNLPVIDNLPLRYVYIPFVTNSP